MSSKSRFALCAMVVLSIVLSPTEAGAHPKKSKLRSASAVRQKSTSFDRDLAMQKLAPAA